MITTPTQRNISRRALELATSGAAGALGFEEARSLHDATRRVVLKLEAGTVRRIDAWIGPDASALQAFVEDEEEPAPTTILVGPAAGAVLLAGVLERTAADIEDEIEVPANGFASLQQMIESVVGVERSSGGCVVAVLAGDGSDNADSAGVVVVQDRRTRWSSIRPGERFTPVEASLAEMWGLVVTLAS